MPMIVRAAVALMAVLAGQQTPAPTPLPQNPSPMTETTRPHPRVAEYVPRGERAAIGQGTLFVRAGAKPGKRIPLIVHFHGAPWLVEDQISHLKTTVALVTFQLGEGSGVYAHPFADPAAFDAVVAGATAEMSRIFRRPVTLDPIILTSWSAGYGAIRAILRQPDHYARVSSVFLADSMHADYTQELAAAATDVDAFQALAADAVAGRKRFVITHSEVFPGTYASTTDTSDAILRTLGMKRRPRLREGPIGMQQLSETVRGKLTVIGYAGNSAPDHADHLYALGSQLTRWKVLKR